MSDQGKQEHLVKGITIIFIANVIGMIFNTALNFLLPKYLTVEAYAGIKTYQLYCTYIGLAHFGYIDGVYLEYGGKKIELIDFREIAIRVNSLRLLELSVSIILVLCSFLVGDNIFFYFVLSILPLNMIGFFQVFYQATGKYSRYSKILNITTIMKTVVSVLTMIFLSRMDYEYFLTGYIILDIALWIWLEILLYREINVKNYFLKPSLAVIWHEIKEGISLRIGVLSGFFLSGMDRIFVKVFMDTNAFAQYAFAAAVENLLNILITPITTTLYNYFCNETKEKRVCNIRNIVMIISMYMLLAFFPVKYALNIFLNDFLDSAGVLAFLFGAKALYLIVQGVYVNLYKAKKQQSKYMYRLVLVIFVGIVLNFLLYKVAGEIEAFAFATWLTTFVWLRFCILDFPQFAFNLKEIVYLISGNSVFLLCACTLNGIRGFVIFLLSLSVVSYLLIPAEMKKIAGYIKLLMKKRRIE